MPPRRRALALLALSSSAAFALACSGGDAPSVASPSSDAGADATTPGDDAAPADDATPAPDAGGASSVTFRYAPSWRGVKAVSVVGAFGRPDDWKQPFLALAPDGTGAFTATAPLPAGQYVYLFKVVGDEAASNAATYARYALDPAEPAFVACPAGSPTFTMAAPNPCSQLTVPSSAAPAMAHARGIVASNGAPAAGWLVVLERAEAQSHHFFVDRATTGADGAYDLAAAPGTYRVQVLYPTYLAQTDAQRTDPAQLGAARRLVSGTFKLDADRALDAAEVAYAGYAAMTPRDAGTLPTTFTFDVVAGTKAQAAVYGPGNEIGDPWWTSPLGTATTAVFDGGFDTKAAGDAGLEPDARYFWGTQEARAASDGGVAWTTQSMVYPIAWP